LKLLDRLTNAIFKNELHIQGLQSIIKIQQGQIDELKKDKERLIKLYEDRVQAVQAVPDIPLDATPMSDTAHWEPLRTMPELPSQRRARLEAASKERLKKMKMDQQKAEAQ
jgi:hypothetical protein